MENDPWFKYNHLPWDERNKAIREESNRISEQHEADQKRAWGPEGKTFQAFGGDYD
jgi:hypothetical protein